MNHRELKLERCLSNRQLFALSFGSIIGVGWITVLGSWVGAAGPAGASLAFLGGGLAVLLIGLCYAEMATAFPVSGGEVAYAHEVFGLRTSFAVGWLLLLGYASVVVFEVISVGWVLEALFPSLRGPVLYRVAGADVTLGGFVAGAGGMIAIAVVNVRGAKLASAFQEMLVYGLIAVSVVFAALAFVRGDVANLQPAFGTHSLSLAAVLPGVLAVLVTAPFWFSGFDVIPQAMGEKASGATLKKIPLVMAFAILFAVLFYVMVIFAASKSLARTELLAADLPTADAIAAALGSDTGGKLVLAAGLLGLISSWNAFTFGASRVLFALGRASIVFPVFGQVHRVFRTPSNALWFIAAIGVVGGFFGRAAIAPVVDTGALGFSLVFLCVCLCAIEYRRRENAMGSAVAAGFKTPAGALIRPLAALLAALIAGYAFCAPIIGEPNRVPVEWLILSMWAVLGLVLYRAGAHGRKTIDANDRRRLVLSDIEDDAGA